jgi:sugar phosphate isomerase/epimerase
MKTFPIAAITDEFSTKDLDAALDGMAAVGMTGAELRVVGGRNMIDLSNEEVDAFAPRSRRRGWTVVSLASPLLKCVLPDSPPLDSRVQHDVFGSPHTFEDQPR